MATTSPNKQQTIPTTPIAIAGIEQLHARALLQLRAEGQLPAVLEHVHALPTDPARTRYVLELLRRLRLLPLDPAPPAKDADLSKQHRIAGNRLYTTQHNLDALQAYNQAIATAPLSSPELALAYGNRSAVLLALKKPQESLSDISTALGLGYDESLKEKLIKRRATCEIHEPTRILDPTIDEARNRIFKPPSDCHPNIPCATSKITLSHDQDTGRKILTTEDILPGEVIAVENPYITILLENYRYLHCYHCCEKSYTLMPCEACSSVMFCSEKCRTASLSQYHKYECPIIHHTQSMGFTKIELLSLRVLLRARCDHESWEEFQDVVAETEAETDPTLKGFVKIGGRNIYDSKYYSSVHAFETNIHKRAGADLFQKTFTCAVFLDLLMVYTPLFADANEFVWFAGGLLLHHVMTAASNMHSIAGLAENNENVFLRSYDYASGAYSFMSLLNHSCNPNVVRQNIGTSTVLLCLRPIKKGEEVLDNYGAHYAMQSIVERLEILNFQYKFQCNCEACMNNWPMYTDLQAISKKSKENLKDVCNKLTSDMVSKLEKGDQSTAISILDQMYSYVTILEKFIPCKDLAAYQETIKQCWGLLGNVFYYEK